MLLEKLVFEYRDAKYVPKKMVQVFMDLDEITIIFADKYDDKELGRMEDARMQMWELIMDCLASQE